MARMRMTGFDEVECFLNKLAQPEKMAVKAVNKAAPVLKKALQSEIHDAANRGYATGELERSIEATKARENHLGVFSVIKPEGENSRGVRNVEVMAYLDHGVKSHGQKPAYVRQRALNRSEAKCEEIMRTTIYEEVDKM